MQDSSATLAGALKRRRRTSLVITELAHCDPQSAITASMPRRYHVLQLRTIEPDEDLPVDQNRRPIRLPRDLHKPPQGRRIGGDVVFYITDPFALEEISHLPPLSGGRYAVNGHVYRTQTPTRHDTTSESPRTAGVSKPERNKNSRASGIRSTAAQLSKRNPLPGKKGKYSIAIPGCQGSLRSIHLGSALLYAFTTHN